MRIEPAGCDSTSDACLTCKALLVDAFGLCYGQPAGYLLTANYYWAGPTKGASPMPTKYRADQVGSFLRPQEVLDAHVAHRDGKLPLEQLRAIEDKAIIECLAM